MKFLNKDGELVDGEPLTDSQVLQRSKIVTFVHETVCRGSYHSAWDRKNETIKCEAVANYFVTHFALTPLPSTDFDKDIEAAKEENMPKAIEAPTLPAPVPVLAGADPDDGLSF